MTPENVWQWLMRSDDDVKGLSGRAVAVLHVIALHADERGIARPGTRRIAALAGCTQSPGRKAIAELIDAGLVLSSPGGFGGPRATTVYALTLGRARGDIEADLFNTAKPVDKAGDVLFMSGTGRIATAPLQRSQQHNPGSADSAPTALPGSAKQEQEQEPVTRSLNGWGSDAQVPDRVEKIREQLRSRGA